jgi:uncharacterized protein (TIGR04255 family)
LAVLQTEEQFRSVVPELGAVLARGYPLQSETRSINYLISPEGIASNDAGTMYRWSSLDDSWHITLTRQFATLYCSRYAGFDELQARLRFLINELRGAIEIPFVDRVGVRYVNRLSEAGQTDSLSDLVKPEVLGYKGLPLAGQQAALRESINQATYTVGQAILIVRSGVMPPGQTPDPAVEAVTTESWILDLDASQEERLLFDPDRLIPRAGRLADIAYDYFKYIVTGGYIKRFSGSD